MNRRHNVYKAMMSNRFCECKQTCFPSHLIFFLRHSSQALVTLRRLGVGPPSPSGGPMPSSCGESAILPASPSPPGVIPLPIRLGSILPADESMSVCLARGSNICSSPLLLFVDRSGAMCWLVWERLREVESLPPQKPIIRSPFLVVMCNRACLWMDNRCECSVFVCGRRSVTLPLESSGVLTHY